MDTQPGQAGLTGTTRAHGRGTVDSRVGPIQNGTQVLDYVIFVVFFKGEEVVCLNARKYF